jgi:hypothetical protein
MTSPLSRCPTTRAGEEIIAAGRDTSYIVQWLSLQTGCRYGTPAAINEASLVAP